MWFVVVAKRVGQVLLLPFLLIGLLVGVIVLVAILCWRAGKVGYRTTRRLADRRT